MGKELASKELKQAIKLVLSDLAPARWSYPSRSSLILSFLFCFLSVDLNQRMASVDYLNTERTVRIYMRV